jgi:hypothetical protein
VAWGLVVAWDPAVVWDPAAWDPAVVKVVEELQQDKNTSWRFEIKWV